MKMSGGGLELLDFLFFFTYCGITTKVRKNKGQFPVRPGFRTLSIHDPFVFKNFPNKDEPEGKENFNKIGNKRGLL